MKRPARAGRNTRPRVAVRSVAALLGCALLLYGCRTQRVAEAAPTAVSGADARPRSDAVLAGTRLEVALATELSTETSVVGDPWAGRLVESVPLLNGGRIPAGSPVDGVVALSRAAGAATEPVLQLGVRAITVNGRDEFISASSESMHAESGSSRAPRAEAPRTAHPVQPGSGSGAWLAGGGEVALAHPARALVTLRDGTVLRFRVLQTVAMR